MVMHIRQEIRKLAHASITYEDVQSSELFYCLRYKVLPSFWLSNVPGHANDLVAVATCFRYQAFELRRRLLVGEVVDTDACAIADVFEYNRAANACYDAGDGGCLSFEQSRHCVVVLLLKADRRSTLV